MIDSYDYGDNPLGGNPPRLASVVLGGGGYRYTAAGHVDDVNAIDFTHDDAGQLAQLARASARVRRIGIAAAVSSAARLLSRPFRLVAEIEAGAS